MVSFFFPVSFFLVADLLAPAATKLDLPFNIHFNLSFTQDCFVLNSSKKTWDTFHKYSRTWMKSHTIVRFNLHSAGSRCVVFYFFSFEIFLNVKYAILFKALSSPNSIWLPKRGIPFRLLKPTVSDIFSKRVITDTMKPVSLKGQEPPFVCY